MKNQKMLIGFLAALLVAWWVGDALFTALLNIITVAVVWYLMKGAGVVRHPMDPLGPSTADVFRLYALALLAIALCLAGLLARAFHETAGKKPSAGTA